MGGVRKTGEETANFIYLRASQFGIRPDTEHGRIRYSHQAYSGIRLNRCAESNLGARAGWMSQMINTVLMG